ncbi:hypothetical protein ACIBAC_00435 [Streptomyces sp. NPDC051362]|uniref:hypothetical protein n=1 Tax=Streptomyces sp. NPDC051362 TaxID=3365651 RepID=UPI00378B124A
MTTATPARAQDSAKLSDRAFRVFYQLTVHSDGGWVDVPSIARWTGVKPHAVRHALSELVAADMVERARHYIRPKDERPTSCTYFRLTTDTSSEATA